MGLLEMVEDAFFNDGDPGCAESFSKSAQGRGIYQGHEPLVRDVAKILHGGRFFDAFDDFFVAELSQSRQNGNGDHGAQRVAVSAFVRVVEGGEALDDGLPRNEAPQEDEIVSGVGQVVLDPLSGKGLFEGMCYHGVDLFERLRHVAILNRQRHDLILRGH